MGWFDSLFGSSESSASRSSDPLAQLDPKLRQFLEKESPVKYHPGRSDAAVADERQSVRQEAETASASATSSSSSSTTSTSAAAASTTSSNPIVPAQSLYPDGRYADIWKTYRPLAEIEAETKSDHERLMDVLDGYQERRAQIGRAALENCALEQVDWNTCIRSGPLSSRLTMCHAEMKKFERCYNMQSVCFTSPIFVSVFFLTAQRLLKALGYLSTYERPPAEDERIQVHADALYHRMLDQEAAVELAKIEGRPAPVVSMDVGISGLPAAASPPIPADVPEDMRKDWAERLAGVPENERPAEEAAMRAELQARLELTGRVARLRAAQAAEREQRKAEGRATLSDRVSGLVWGK
ncbi:hypothetical protein CMQ_7947 [Grosmannia clavigera kw1407]|uniref:Autophagy protein n=1 Tax=Grosmannia clavigera (strain kw1407 / UAMH 11150) TaxID=655863 RepID=F0XS64_GROCL|nr:uncharacterized protein CMQ_7947 [Grosmannia clavigera kw1407]EFW99579.1 hypothetical protein CMQ_7947 [Grosmannia clavigera kw1407]